MHKIFNYKTDKYIDINLKRLYNMRKGAKCHEKK